MGVVGRTRTIFDSIKIGLPNILVTPGYVARRIIQVIVSDAEVIAETLSISDAMQGFPNEIFLPLLVILCGD
jgi:hypothetical protein